MPEFTGTKDLRSYVRIVWRWKYLLLAFVVVTPLVAYLIARGQPRLYQSSTLVGVNTTTVPRANSTTPVTDHAPFTAVRTPGRRT